MRPSSLLIPAALALSLTACLGGGKVPPILLTLAPEAPAPASFDRSASAGETVTIDDPVTPKSLKVLRIPANVGDTAIAYIKDAQWIDLPGKLFQQLVSETIKRTTNRVVLDPRQSSLDPGLRVTGLLDRFGYDASQGGVVVRYDAALAATAGARVETRRFEARERSDGTKASVGPALNRAANRVANDVASWVGNHG
ncbi:MAG: ABC-type transport auxiliary lipoprotein family protein [Sphingomicrobium sp.]